MLELIFFIIFILSLGGILLILARKIPVLNSLPQNGTTGIKKHHYILEAEQKLKDIFVFFEKQIYLHKLLSWIKVLTLKIETRVDKSLHKIRSKSKK
ncbi:MAG: hypothetical protein NTV36_00120 [Candidatus Staskawiczbacteria bacterium]|nr:hypothetical protein [Candidatus Staskawiczbacteria bacterium]